MTQPLRYNLLQKSTVDLNQALVAFFQTKPESQDRDVEKVKVLKELGAVCALVEHLADAGELLPSELQKAIDLKNQQLEVVLQWPRPSTFLVLV